MSVDSFAVSRFKNRNGVISWRVSGWRGGLRIRKTFLCREDAAAEKASLGLRAVQATAGMRSALTFLTDERLRQAEDVFRRLEGRPQSLFFYLDYAFANYREPARQVKLDAAVEAYVAKRAEEHDRTLLSIRQLTAIKFELGHLVGYFPGAAVAQFAPAILIPYLERGNPALKTYNNRRDSFPHSSSSPFSRIGSAPIRWRKRPPSNQPSPRISGNDFCGETGNSESIIRWHYLDLKSREEAAAFFEIVPVLRPFQGE